MIRRFNFTGRRKITLGAFAVDLTEDPDGVPSFSCQLDLAPNGAPSGSSVYVEAYSRFAFRRFPLGTVGRLSPPTWQRLPNFEGSPVIRFRLKVIDETEQHGRILAAADGITPRDPEVDGQRRVPLLPVEATTELGQQVWKLAFDQDGPVLLVNNSIEGIYSIVAGDSAFQSLVFPAAVRQILWEIVGAAGEADPWGFPEDWQTRWLKFGMRFYREEPPAGEEATDSDRHEWIDGVLHGFCEWLRARDIFEVGRARPEEG